MISKISGIVEEKFASSVIINVGGVGYEVFVSTKNIQTLQVSKNVSVYTAFIVTKDLNFSLYGFLTRNEFEMFKLLCTVSGVGPKSAFTVLAYGSVAGLARAISEADKNYFKDISGIGQKLALKIIVELQDKVGKSNELIIEKHLAKSDQELVSAVSAMGYNATHAAEIISQLDSTLSENEKLQLLIAKLAHDKNK
jgi:holliday junction DNA helicase RuvA